MDQDELEQQRLLEAEQAKAEDSSDSDEEIMPDIKVMKVYNRQLR